MNQFVSPPWLGSWQYSGVNKFIPTSVISITVAIMPQSFCRGMMAKQVMFFRQTSETLYRQVCRQGGLRSYSSLFGIHPI